MSRGAKSPGWVPRRLGTRNQVIPQGSIMGDRHADVSPEDWTKIWSLVLRMGLPGQSCIMPKDKVECRHKSFMSIREEKAELKF